MSSNLVSKGLGALAACAAALAITAAPTAASADTHWVVTGTFDDGGLLSGSFDINVYGQLSDAALHVTGGAFPTFDYTMADSYTAAGTADPIPPYDYHAPFYVDFQPSYFADLHLEFQNGLITPLANNPILGGFEGPSYECGGSFSCYIPDTTYGGAVRYLTGSATAAGGGVPEPAAWALMLVGFGGLGAALRSARRQRALATA
jgi:hypothetical protein